MSDDSDVVVVSERQLQWLQFGKQVDQAKSPEQMLKDGGLDWTVEKRKLYVENAKGNKILVKDRFATVRPDTEKVLGIVADRYHVFPNLSVARFVQTLADDDQVACQAAFTRRNDKVVGFVVKLGDSLVVLDEDQVDTYLLVQSAHDGTKGLNAHVVNVNIRCTNMVDLAVRGALQKWSITHVSTMEERAAEARASLNLTTKYRQEYAKVAEQLAKSKLELDEFRDMLADILPDRPKTPKVIEKMEELFTSSPTISPKLRNTAWGGLQAISEYMDWGRSTRSPEARFQTSAEGAGANLRNRAARLLLSR